jgi:ADP-heptose:LPS heptosyltransferase
MSLLSIGVVRRNGLGDLLCGIPLIYLLKERGAHITLLTDVRSQELARLLPEIDEVIVLPSKYLSLAKVWWELRHREFDLLISAKPTPMKLVNILFAGLKAKEKRAVVKGGWHSRFINAPVEMRTERTHQTLRCLQILDPTIQAIDPKYYPKISVKKKIFNLPGKKVFVSVSNNRIGSRLDFDRYAKLLSGCSVVINGEPGDEERAEALASLLKVPYEVVITPTLQELLSLLAGVDVVFIGDGGVMHLAAALGKPQLVLFGGTKVWEWAPLSKDAICLYDEHNVNFIRDDLIRENLERLIHA